MTLKKYRDGRVGYGVPLFYRLILLSIGLIILVPLILFSPDVNAFFSPKNIIPLLVAFLSLFAALYHEQWVFDKNKERVFYKTGLVFLHKTKSFSFRDVKAVELIHYLKGGNVKSFFHKLPGQHVWLLSLCFHDEKKINIETRGSFTGKTLVKTGTIIAEYCEIPFINRTTPGDYGSK
ncbi:MAG: hypothetical protein JXB88_25375 [Spirochaetales bacterium]|nr:hypothetical protein [Spirochaetales bacterium]